MRSRVLEKVLEQSGHSPPLLLTLFLPVVLFVLGGDSAISSSSSPVLSVSTIIDFLLVFFAPLGVFAALITFLGFAFFAVATTLLLALSFLDFLFGGGVDSMSSVFSSNFFLFAPAFFPLLLIGNFGSGIVMPFFS